MAGSGFREFESGAVLTAAQVQNFLQDQVVMVFDDSAARTSALGTFVSEGMITFLKDTDALEFHDGSSFQPVSNPGDITAVTAGTALTGGGSSGAVTLDFDFSTAPPFTSSTATTFTISTSDAGSYLRFTNAATITVGTATDFTAGQQTTILADGTALTITTDGATIAGAGTSTTSGSFTVGAQYEAVSVLCVDTDTYRVIGNITAV